VNAGRTISPETLAALARTYRSADDLARYEELVRHVPPDYPQREALIQRAGFRDKQVGPESDT